MPKVSVIIPSYNHEKYIRETIQSVLNQTFQDFEIVITDDCSKDNSVAEIKKFKDPRIKLFCFKKNQGVCPAINNCLKESRGEYIAQLNSDDVFLPNKLEKQVLYLNSHPNIGAVFSYAQMIDENGNDITDSSHHHGIMNTLHNRNKHQWLNYFFYNCRWLWHPSMIIRQEVYDVIGNHDNRLAQIQDFDIGIKLSLKYEIYIIPERLTKFRIRKDNKNASAQTPEAVVRSMFEFSHVLKNYLKIKDVDEFLKIFPEAKNKYRDIVDDKLIPFYAARQALEVEHVFHQKFALDTVFDLLSNEKIVKKLNTTCNFDYDNFIKLTGKYDLYHVNHIEYQNNLINKLKYENEELKKPKTQMKDFTKLIINKISFGKYFKI